MISSNDIKKGLTLDIEGEPYMVLEWQHVAKAQETKIRMKLRHLPTGTTIERTVGPGHKLKLAPVTRRLMTFSYWDGESYHFLSPGVLNPDEPDEIILPPEKLGEARKYIVDNLQLDLLLLNNEPVAVDVPESVMMHVKETEPAVGAADRYKRAIMEGPARLETGLAVRVPSFISPGDWIRVRTANGDYIERV
jgi:elongation factor P